MKTNVIKLNILHLNTVRINGRVEMQGVSLQAGEIPEPPVVTTYTLAANVSNGKVTATKNGTAISLPYVATEGDVIVLSVTPDEGYEFNGWLDGNKSNPRTVTMTGNVVLSASCVEIAKPTYTLSASVTNGKVSATLNGSAVNLPFTANEGDTIVVEVTPNDGYTFEGWADGNTDNPRSITMTADVVLSANCVEVVQPPVGNYIQFEDKAVEAICVANWSSDGIGLTEEDAAKVTSLNRKFLNNKDIVSFEEFQYFTRVTEVSGNLSWGGDFYGCTSLKKIKFPSSITSIQAIAFYGCSELTTADIPESVTDIGQQAFLGCNKLTSKLYLPNLISLGVRAFRNCHSLGDIENLGAITAIQGDNGGGTFESCRASKMIRIPASVTKIGAYALYGCSSLEKIICEATTPPSLANATTLTSTNSCPIYVPDASLEAYKTAVNWSAYADRIHPLSEIEDYYVSDALLMHLDGINKGNVEGEWQDLVGSIVFTNKGATASDKYWHFDGSGYLESNDTGYRYSENRTIEIVFEIENFDANAVLLAMSASQYGFGLFKTSGVIAASMDMNSVVYPLSYTKGSIATVAITRSTLYTNGEVIAGTQQSSIAFSADTMYIGRRSTGNNFYGKIYAIRIHDRALSEEEILYNQRIDNKRFNLGLDI